jgi:hypothetical protein
MSWRNPRRILLVCAGLDLLGLSGLAALISVFKPVPLFPQLGWLLFTAGAYLGLGWLFGSYTVLRWPGLRVTLLIKRLLLTAGATGLALVLLGWLLDTPERVTLLHRGTLLLLLGLPPMLTAGPLPPRRTSPLCLSRCSSTPTTASVAARLRWRSLLPRNPPRRSLPPLRPRHRSRRRYLLLQ